MNTTSSIINWLFQTRAIQVAPHDQPFWYTSGKLGPYYINTHFLYGSQESAEDLLEAIELFRQEPLSMPGRLTDKIMTRYHTDEIYHELINLLADLARGYRFDFISGGERRDYFFSIPVAAILAAPHLSILKNGRCLISEQGFTSTIWAQKGSLHGEQFLHIADLVTEASSYLRTWIPAIRELGGEMQNSLAVIDRKQGGEQALSEAGTGLKCLAAIDADFFDRAVQAGLLSTQQQTQILLFMENPDRYMEMFLQDHPAFLTEQLAMGGKNAERARRCLESGYGFIGS